MSITPVGGRAPLPEMPEDGAPSSAPAAAPVVRGSVPVRPFRSTEPDIRELDGRVDLTQPASSKAAEAAAVKQIVNVLKTGIFDWAVTRGDAGRALAELEKLDPAAWIGSVVCLAAQRGDTEGSWLQKLFGRGLDSPELQDRFAAQCAAKLGPLVGRPLSLSDGRNVAMALGLRFREATSAGDVATAIAAGAALLVGSFAGMVFGARAIAGAFQ